jgi:hypothetical protein
VAQDVSGCGPAKKTGNLIASAFAIAYRNRKADRSGANREGATARGAHSVPLGTIALVGYTNAGNRHCPTRSAARSAGFFADVCDAGSDDSRCAAAASRQVLRRTLWDLFPRLAEGAAERFAPRWKKCRSPR